MLAKNKYLYIATERGTIENMAQDILRNISREKTILKIVFFAGAKGDEEYLNNRDVLIESVKREFPTATPLVSYVAQQTATEMLTAEVITLEQEAAISRNSSYIILENNGTRELMTSGIVPEEINASTFTQATDIFHKITRILAESRFTANDIYRQWNYIQGITVENNGSQNYQEFNDARSIFYSAAEWDNGYPAATGIGSCAGGVMVDLYAVQGGKTNYPIDNPLQIAAHNYSQKVLAQNNKAALPEKTTPKFERARITGTTIHISGTAAIRGEVSSESNDIISQTEATMQIMDHLVSPQNIPVNCNNTVYDFLRVYVKHKSDIPCVQQYMEQHYPTPLKHYLVSDICRPELLIEIEGTAHIL